MIDFNDIVWLMGCFEGSFINQHGEFIANKKCNAYFNLTACRDMMEVKCKVLEWLSRSASSALAYSSDRRNKKMWDEMRKGINDFLGTSFTHEDMEEIYTYLGNCVNRPKTIRFIESGYDLAVLAGDPHDSPGQ